MLHLLESGGLGMWNDAVFPSSLSSSSVSNLGSAEPWLQSSKASMELERLNCGNFCGTLPNSYGYSLQSHNFPTCLDSNAGFITGSYGDPMMTTTAAAAAAAAAGSLSCVTAGVQYPKVGPERRKRLIARDPANKHKTPSKRLKSCYLQNESATLAGMPLSRASVRRSQKLGDKITALQQLVSPFGKTDTASVLHEAALSIKFLHEQIRMLTAPCFGIGSSEEHLQGEAESSGELQTRGLCVVPLYAIVGLMDVEEAYGGGCWPETMIGRQSSDPSFD